LKQFVENPFLMGVHDVFESFYDPETSAPKFLASLAVGSTIPNILQQWGTRVYDPVVREPKTFIERIKARVPFGVSEDVKPLRNMFGQEIVRDVPWAQALGFGLSLPKGGKAEKELVRLGISVGKPSRIVDGKEMNDDEYERFYILKGHMLKESVDRFVNAPAYNQINDDVKIKTIRRIIRKVNDVAKHKEMSKYYR